MIYKTTDVLSKFIKEYGFYTYGPCPCGSGEKFKYCCMKNKKSYNDENYKNFIYSIKKEIYKRENWPSGKCQFRGCLEDTVLCHSIQNNRFLNKICDLDKKVYHILPDNAELQNFKIEGEKVSVASTFNAFCNSHDRKLFSLIEGKNIINFNNEQKYIFTYRNFYYMYMKLYMSQVMILKKQVQYNIKYLNKNSNFKSYLDLDRAFNLIVDIRKNSNLRDELKEIIEEIEQNFDKNIDIDIVNNCLHFSDVRTLNLNNNNFCFQTVREYLEYGSDNDKDLDSALNEKRYNFLSTIILPEFNTSNVSIFFSISKKCTSTKLINFVNNINLLTDYDLINLINNIILNATEEFYFSKSEFYDKLDSNTQEKILEFIKDNYKNEKILFFDNLLHEPSVNIVNLL